MSSTPEQAAVEAGYRGPVIPLSSLVEPFIALAGVYAAVPAAFTMPLEDVFAAQHLGKILEVQPKAPGRPARLARVVSGAQLMALIAGLPEARTQLAALVQARLDAEMQTEAYQAALERYHAALQEMQAARQTLEGRLIEAARPFDLAQFASLEGLSVESPRLTAVEEASGRLPGSLPEDRPSQRPARERLRTPDSADWSLDQYETEWNREHIVLRRAPPGQWEVISGAVGYVESSDDSTLHARGDTPNRAWRNFLVIRGRQPSVSTPRQFRAAEAERAARRK